MTPNDLNKNEETNKQSVFLKRSQTLLDNSLNDIDDDIKNELYARRRQVLGSRTKLETQPKLFSRFKTFIPTFSVAITATLIITVLLNSGIWQSNDAHLKDELELVTTLEQIELYEDFEFYQWLVEEDIQAG